MKKIVFLVFVAFLFSMCGNNSENVDNEDSQNIEEDYSDGDTDDYSDEIYVDINLEPLEIVTSFVEYLGNHYYESAYNLQKNEKWGDYEQFSSKDAFGSINETEIIDIYLDHKAGHEATVIAEIIYYDAENGDNQFLQKFTLHVYEDEGSRQKVGGFQKYLYLVFFIILPK